MNRTSAGATPKSTKSASEIEFGAEPRGSLERARDAAVEAVEHRGADDGDHRPVDRPFHREPNGGEPEAKRQKRHDIGQQEPQRDRAEAAL